MRWRRIREDIEFLKQAIHRINREMGSDADTSASADHRNAECLMDTTMQMGVASQRSSRGGD